MNYRSADQMSERKKKKCCAYEIHVNYGLHTNYKYCWLHLNMATVFMGTGGSREGSNTVHQFDVFFSFSTKKDTNENFEKEKKKHRARACSKLTLMYGYGVTLARKSHTRRMPYMHR